MKKVTSLLKPVSESPGVPFAPKVQIWWPPGVAASNFQDCSSKSIPPSVAACRPSRAHLTSQLMLGKQQIWGRRVETSSKSPTLVPGPSAPAGSGLVRRPQSELQKWWLVVLGGNTAEKTYSLSELHLWPPGVCCQYQPVLVKAWCSQV